MGHLRGRLKSDVSDLENTLYQNLNTLVINLRNVRGGRLSSYPWTSATLSGVCVFGCRITYNSLLRRQRRRCWGLPEEPGGRFCWDQVWDKMEIPVASSLTSTHEKGTASTKPKSNSLSQQVNRPQVKRGPSFNQRQNQSQKKLHTTHWRKRRVG